MKRRDRRLALAPAVLLAGVVAEAPTPVLAAPGTTPRLLQQSSAPLPAERARGAWQASGSGEDMRLSLEAAAAIPLALDGSYLARSAHPRLELMCDKRRPRVGLRLGRLSRRQATVRLDRDPAFEAELANQTRGGIILDAKVVDPDFFHFDDPRELIGQLLSHRKMLVRVVPMGQPARNVSFGLDGLEGLLGDFERACGLEEPIERPEVADVEVPRPEPSAGEPRLDTIGAWKVLRTVSKLDDRPVVILVAEAGEGAPPPGNPASLVLRCQGGESEAYLKFQRPLFGSGFVVQASVDGGKSREWRLGASTDRMSQFFRSGPQLLKRLLASQQLRLVYGRSKPRKNDEWMPEGEVVFSLEGLYEASLPFVEACDIDLAKVKVKDGLEKLSDSGRERVRRSERWSSTSCGSRGLPTAPRSGPACPPAQAGRSAAPRGSARRGGAS